MATEPVVDLDTLIAFYRDDPEASTQMPRHKWVRWAARCASRVLHNYEAKYPDDTRPRDAIRAAEAYAANPTKANAYAAHAADAAADAADAATNATNAAYAAAYAAADAAAYAADAAAYAAYGAAYAAADAAEKQWQAIRLMAIYHGDEA